MIASANVSTFAVHAFKFNPFFDGRGYQMCSVSVSSSSKHIIFSTCFWCQLLNVSTVDAHGCMRGCGWFVHTKEREICYWNLEGSVLSHQPADLETSVLSRGVSKMEAYFGNPHCHIARYFRISAPSVIASNVIFSLFCALNEGRFEEEFTHERQSLQAKVGSANSAVLYFLKL